MLSSAVLQWIAVITMVIDHVGLYLMGNHLAMRVIGRLALPIFVFLLAEGFRHTRSKWRYFGRLMAFALLAELPIFTLSVIGRVGFAHNIMFTLAVSLLALMCFERGGWFYVLAGALALIASLLKLDYGAFAVLMAMGYYYVLQHFSIKSLGYKLGVTIVAGLTMGAMALIRTMPLQIMAILAAVPLLFYSGKRGKRMPHRFFYFFYPAHLLAIMLIRLISY